MRSPGSSGSEPLLDWDGPVLETLFNNLQPIGVGTWFTRARGASAYAVSQATEVLARRNIRQAS